MEKLLAAFFTGIVIAFVAPVLGTLIGAFMGWVVGIFFGNTIMAFLAAIGVKVAGLTMWQVGAAMGFLGSFLRTTVSKTN